MEYTDLLFTDYKISTMTTTGTINTKIDLKTLYNYIEIVDKESVNNGIIYIEYNQNKFDVLTKGQKIKREPKNRKNKPKKRFQNQTTMIIKINQNYTNLKLFKNGNIQMTGVKNELVGKQSIDILIEEIRKIYQKDNIIVENIDMLQNKNFEINLINTDFKINKKLKREELHKLMITKYNIISSYEPCIYPGVKIQYFYNQENTDKDGICKCSGKCSGKGKNNSCGDGNCKKISILVFQSGSIIITGSSNREQIDETYNFIKKVFTENIEIIKKNNPIY